MRFAIKTRPEHQTWAPLGASPAILEALAAQFAPLAPSAAVA